jgi:DNA-binding transcriptional ArsR family regulator
MLKSIYAVKAEFFKALGHPARIRILELLREGERSAGEIVADLDLEQSNVSQLLGVLRRGGLVSSRRDGATIYYAVKDPRIFDLLLVAKEILTSTLNETHDMLTDLEGIDYTAKQPRKA